MKNGPPKRMIQVKDCEIRGFALTGPDGITTYFEYDSWGRLIRSYIIEDGIQKILSTFDYNTPHYQF